MSVTLWVTNECNLKCKYCYEGEKEHLKIDIAKVNDIIEFILHYNYVKDGGMVSFHGGEPFLEFEIIKYFIKKMNNKGIRLRYALTTNGTILSEDIIRFVIENNIELTISIDGNKKVNDVNRIDYNGNSVFDKVVSNIRLLLTRGIKFRVRSTFNSLTVKYLFNSVNFIVSLGCDCLVLAPDESDKMFTDQDMVTLEKEINKIYEKYGNDDNLAINCYVL